MPIADRITWHRQTSVISPGALADLHKPGTALSLHSGNCYCVVVEEAKNQQHRDVKVQGSGNHKRVICSGWTSKIPICCMEGICLKFQGRRKETI